MRLPPTNCSFCNSLQRFAPKKRVAAGRIETFIVCQMCKTEKVIDTATVEEVRSRRRNQRRRNQRIRHIR